MKKHLPKRLLSLLLALVLCVGLVAPAAAAESEENAQPQVSFEKVDNSEVTAELVRAEVPELDAPAAEEPAYLDTDVVRVSIVLYGKSTLERGYSTEDIAENDQAMAYRSALEQKQETVEKSLTDMLGELDVVWNLTLAANIISANVQYGQIAAIESHPSVQRVVIETCYAPAVVDDDLGADPNMATSGTQIGRAEAYALGYYGAGSRIAIIDTGVDVDHQSFNAGAFEYALAEAAESTGETEDAYIASLDLLDKAEIDMVLEELNAYKEGLTAEELYLTSKIPYAFNYVDENLTVNHMNDTEGEHGSHVSGIATANRYVPDGEGGYVSALDQVKVQGVAPDAQLITMKVFGQGGGAYDADYMAAIEDAILLGCDAINLSLGSARAGFARNEEYAKILNWLSESDTVVVMSAGNNSYWAENSIYGTAYGVGLYGDDVNFATGGSPGTYTNSLAVASVDNAGSSGGYLVVGENQIFYIDTSEEYGAKAISSLAGQKFDYILIDGYGTAEDFKALGESALNGKVAVCSRGQTSFYQKANAAAAYGASATIVYNNQEGTISMSLSGYGYQVPCISITMADGNLMRDAAKAVKDDEGNVLYYEGTLQVSESVAVSYNDPEYYTMSSFSSWGVPGDLTLKPEITAPGGNIYSVDGSHLVENSYGQLIPVGGTDAYENMSGTSMAAPQVTGMMALLAQYIKENNLKQEGLTVRALAQSLLMSTAEPMIDGESGSYYPVLQQGAGLANVGAAIAADSYILMGKDATKSYADGKVKAELGDDPDRTGVYSFSFSVNNLTDEEQCYTLSSKLFTQDLYYGFLDTWTTGLQHTAVWTANGVTLQPDASLARYDFNGDGEVNGEDCTALLDFVTGKRPSITNADLAADLDKEDGVSTRDAYVFLTMMNEGAVSVPANGSVEVQVTLTLTDGQKETLDTYYENGAYIEGYVYVTGLTTEEGVLGSVHSIPVLAFYGNWSDASMFEHDTMLDYLYGTYSDYPYTYTLDDNYNIIPNTTTHYLTLKNPGQTEDAFLGNPLNYVEWNDGESYLQPDVYREERNAVRSDTVLSKLYFTPIRNAYASKLTVSDGAGTKFIEAPLGAIYSTYYSQSYGEWMGFSQRISLNLSPEDLWLEDGDYLDLTLTLAPEYYVDAEGNVDWEALGKGTSMSIGFTVDDTEPEITNVDAPDATEETEAEQKLTMTVQDNNYVAGILLFAEDGDELIDAQLVDQEYPNTGYKASFDASELEDDVYLIQVWDFAGNISTYRLFYNENETKDVSGMEISEESITLVKGNSKQLSARALPKTLTDRSVIWSSDNEEIATVDEQTGLVTAVAVGTCNVTATSKLDDSKTATCEVEVITIDEQLSALIWDERGQIWWSSFHTDTLPEYTKDAAGSNLLASVSYGPGGKLYAASLDTDNEYSSLYEVSRDAETITTIYLGDSEIAYTDLSYAPNLGYLMATYFNYIVLVDSETGNYVGAWKWVPEDTALVGIAYCGSLLNTYYDQYMDFFYLIDNSGTVYMEAFIALDGNVYNFYGSDDESVQFSTGRSVGSTSYFNSAYYDFDSGYLFWSAFDFDTNCVDLYAIDADYSGDTYYLGSFEDSVWPVGGLFKWNSDDETTDDSLRTAKVDSAALTTAEVKQTAVETVEPIAVPASSTPKGGLNSTAVLREEVSTRSAGGYNPWQDTVTVKLTAQDANGRSVASNNGEMTVSYNPASLELVEVQSNAAYSSYVDENGVVTFAYAQLEAIPAGAAVATLKFAVRDLPVGTIHVNHLQVNEDLHVNTTEALYPRVDLSGGNGDITLPILPGFGSGSSASKPTEAMDFTDVSKSDPFYDAVKYVYEEGLMNGTGNGKFSPYGTLTRAMVVTILYRIEGEPATRYNGMFRDVANYQWYTDAVEWAAKNNIVTGYTSGKFGPEDPVTREQLAAILYRYALSKGSVLPAGNSLTAYADGSNVSSYAVSAVKWAVAEGILEAQNGKLQPRDAANRAQVAIAVAAFHQKYVK